MSTAFQAALNEYQRLLAAEDAIPPTQTDEDVLSLHAATVLTDEAYDALLECPTATVDEAMQKLDVVIASTERGVAVHGLLEAAKELKAHLIVAALPVVKTMPLPADLSEVAA